MRKPGRFGGVGLAALTIAAAVVHEAHAVGGLPVHGSDPEQPTPAPQTRVVVYVSTRADSRSALIEARAKWLAAPAHAGIFELV